MGPRWRAPFVVIVVVVVIEVVIIIIIVTITFLIIMVIIRGSGHYASCGLRRLSRDAGHRLSASRILWRFSAWCPTALVASALSQNGRSATSASLEQKQCPSCNLRGEALWWASRAVHLHVQERSTGGDRTQV